jgi:MerR family transcriptional regulator, thiopeptide resistance regulator
MHVSTTRPGLRIGAVAKATGLTVRTLHHYDAIGLLRPTERSEAGYRLYDEADLRRLYRIIAMRGMGFPLETIGRALDHQGEDPRPAVRDHLRQVEEQLRLAAQLQAKLTGVLEVLDRSDEPSGDLFMEIIEVMTKMERYYTPEQLEGIEQRRLALGEDGMAKAQRDWAELIAAVEAERVAGTDPADPRLEPLVDRWNALIEAFTGGDPGTRASLQRMYEENDPQEVSRGAMNAETMAYAQRALQAYAR